jgi:hypothetical protein
MPARDLARLLVKIAGLIILIYGFTDLPITLGQAFAIADQTKIVGATILSVVAALPSLIAGIVLFAWPDTIVERALARPAETTDAVPCNSRTIEEIALTVLGFYIVASGAAEGFYYWAQVDLYYRYAAGTGYMPTEMTPTQFGGIGAAVTRLVLGTLLIVTSRGLVALRRRLLSLRPMAANR